MAVLNNIRKHGIFLIIVIALALFAFILADVVRQGGFSTGNSQNTIATINGEDISRMDFSDRVQAAQQNNRGRDVTTIQAVDQVWDATMKQTLVHQQIEKLGIDVASEQIVSALAQQFGRTPAFQTDGRFDINKLKAYINQIRASNPQQYQQWLRTEQEITGEAKANVYFDLLGAGLSATTVDAKEAYKLAHQSFDLAYVKVPYSAVDDENITVTDKDIKQYIKQHKREYKAKGARDIQYVLFEDTASAADQKAVKDELVELLNDHKVYNKAAEMEEEVEGFKNTEDYESYLTEHSDLSFDGDYVFKSDLPIQYADTLFKLSKGESFGPYQEDGYWKYTKVADQRQMADSVKLKHILISYKGLPTGQNSERSEAEAEQLADSLTKVVQQDKSKFADLAKEYSDDPSSAKEGGAVGWLAHQQGNSNPLIDFAFQHSAGSIDVVKTQFGFHIAFVEDEKDERKVLKLATLAKKIAPSEKTSNQLYNDTYSFRKDAEDNSFGKAAKEHSYKVRTVKDLGPMDEHVIGIGNERGIVQWAFEKNTKPGAIKRFNVDQGYVVVQLTSSISEGMQSVEEAADKVKPILMKKKKGEYLTSKINSNDLNEIASQYKSEVSSKDGVTFKNPILDGREPKVVGRAFSLNKGEVSKPIAGNSGVYVLKVKSVEKAQAPDSYKEVIAQENEKIRKRAAQDLLDALESKAKINDRRAEFY